MSFKLILRIQGFLLLFLGACMAVPALIAVLYHEDAGVSFILAAVMTTVTGAVCIVSFPAAHKQITHREGFVIVSLGWILAALFGSLPFLFENTFTTFTNAYFETVSGFTTTGATVLHDVESLPHTILFWRSMIQWLGGMGIILFSIAILPLLGIGGMQLYKAEVPGPVVEKIKPRIAETARSLWKVYILLSLVEALLLMLCGMSPFDAVCHTFTTMATGGFSTKNRSIESFQNPLIEYIMVLFMFAAGVNFSLHYRVCHGKIKGLLKDKEFLFYCSFLAGAVIVIAVTLTFLGDAHGLRSFRLSLFQATSILTTTGYSSANFDLWPLFAKLILLMLMFVGGCAGSTAGGMKCVRILLVLKRCYRELFLMVHPHAVAPIKLGARSVSETVMKGLTGFIILYLFLFIIGSLLMSLFGLDITASLSSVAASLGNIGPGLGAVGPYETYAFIPSPGKWILIIMMLLGRLEIFTLLILFIPEFWKK